MANRKLTEVLAVTLRHYERAEQLIASYGFRYRLRTLDALQLCVAGDLLEGLLDYVVASDRVLREVEHFSVIDPERS